jgi:hypothetical protein
MLEGNSAGGEIAKFDVAIGKRKEMGELLFVPDRWQQPDTIQ